MVALIYNIKEKKLVSDVINVEKLSKVLQIAVNDDIMVLPNITLGWLWNDAVLEMNLGEDCDGKVLTLKSVVTDDVLFFKNIRSVLDALIDNLPKSFKSKLKLNKIDSRLELKHNVMSALMYA